MGSIKKRKLGYTTNQYMVPFVTSWCFKNFDRQGSVAKKRLHKIKGNTCSDPGAR